MNIPQSPTAQRKQNYLNLGFLILALVCIFIGGIIAISDSGPAAALNSLQAFLMGEDVFYPVLTAFLLVLPILLTLLAIKVVIVAVHNRYWYKDKPEEWLKYRGELKWGRIA